MSDVESHICAAMDHLQELPTGIDYEAEATDTSDPEDLAAYVAGLVWKELQAALKLVRKIQRADY